MKTLRKGLIVLCLLTVGVVGFIGIRYAWAAVQVNVKRSQVYLRTASFGSTRSLTILPLFDEAAGQANLEMGHGVSYLIKTDTSTVLFDAGNNPGMSVPFSLQSNMQKLGVSLDEIDAVVLSHNHPDHVGGEEIWAQRTFAFDWPQSPLGDRPLYVPEAITYPGTTPIIVSAPQKIGEGILSMGPISFSEVFPMWLFQGSGTEQALAILVQGQGIYLITGCGHPGLEPMLQRAEQLFDQPVVGIIGGLHYMGMSDLQVEPQVKFTQTLNLKLLALSPHDSDPNALQMFEKALPGVYQTVRVGQKIEIP